MKKLVFSIIIALVLVISGVTTVAAYEGHEVDVRAHVENAIWTETDDLNFGTVFPEEQKESDFWIGLSQSFLDQTVYSSVQYSLWWEPKPITDPDSQNPALDADNDTYYENIYPYITLDIDGNTPSTSGQRSISGVKAAGLGALSTPVDTTDNIHLVLNPPVFDGWYNSVTDPKTPSGVLSLENKDYVVTNETFTVADGSVTVGVPKTDLGNILKIQVEDIVVHTGS